MPSFVPDVAGEYVASIPVRDTLDWSDPDTVVVTAVPDSGWVFDAWSDGLTGSDNPDTLIMGSDTTVTATLDRKSVV